MKSFFRLSALFAAIVSVCAISLRAARSIPAGTVLPVRLDSTLSSVRSHSGQLITARVMQTVPLPGSMVPAGAKVIGHIVNVSASGASISVVFDTLETRGEKIPIATNLRAIASFVAVSNAQIPDTGADRGTPESAWTTTQVGGDSVYRGGGHVEGINGIVGEPVAGGVLSHIYANEEGGCRGPINPNDSLQALWVFSSNACGAYGFSDLKIRHTGRTAPTGQITLDSASGPVKIERGAGLLLRVNSTGVSGA